MDKQCLACGKTFSGMPHYIKQRRFCSKRCFYQWHRGENNPQTQRVQLACEHCGQSFAKVPSHVWAHNYCSDACARAEHGGKITGANHPNWRGGALGGRGPSWRMLRAAVLERQGHKCADCAMSEAEHVAKYGHSLHVHHRSPYRLALDNSPDNLIALCIPCHGLEESATRRQLSPADFALMRQRREHDRSLGLHIDDYSRVYDACPQCGTQKAKRATLCRACRNADRAANRLPHFRCPECGGYKTTAVARVCWPCRLEDRRR